MGFHCSKHRYWRTTEKSSRFDETRSTQDSIIWSHSRWRSRPCLHCGKQWNWCLLRVKSSLHMQISSHWFQRRQSWNTLAFCYLWWNDNDVIRKCTHLGIPWKSMGSNSWRTSNKSSSRLRFRRSIYVVRVRGWFKTSLLDDWRLTVHTWRRETLPKHQELSLQQLFVETTRRY